MRVLHVPYCYFPDKSGGTEVYVEGLAICQQSLGVTAAVAAPAGGMDEYQHNGVPVFRFKVGQPDLRQQYGEGDPVAADNFARVLDIFDPSVVHLHAFTSAVSLRLIRTVKSRQIPVLFTYHTPTVSCSRGTLLQWGHAVCDGRLDLHRCAACSIEGKGAPRWLATMLGAFPPRIGALISKSGLTGPVWTSLRMTDLQQIRHAALRSALGEVDHIVAVCAWVRELLLGNGIPPARITVSRQGLHPVAARNRPVAGRVREAGLPLRFAFLGRLSPEKGLPVVLRALAQAPELMVTVDAYCLDQHPAGENLAGLREQFTSDRRIRFFDPVPPGHVPALLADYDALLVPSLGLETGPLVVNEAFAAGTPVLGSNLGGIAELVTDGTNGILLPAGCDTSWRRTFEQLVRTPEILDQLRRGIPEPRLMSDVAHDTQQLYEDIVARESASILPV
jgi:glycosyltransferase involved in cell wall biosynthesis